MKVSNMRTLAKGGSVKAGCPIPMGVYLGARRCGRTLHASPSSVDKEPVCLMHSKDPRKLSGKLFDAFWLEFERTLEAAREGEAHFERFVFPQFEYMFQRRNFQAICRFVEAIFTVDADFLNVTFSQEADFSKATFMQIADFSRACFTKNADFSEATFTQGANFYSTAFTKDAVFVKAIFTMNAEFRNASFLQGANFSNATFAKDAVFGNTTFSRDADFSSATFTQDANFSSVTFTQDVNFQFSTFKRSANFESTIFTKKAKFFKALFIQNAEFHYAAFKQNANFSNATFSYDAGLSEVTFTQSAHFVDTEFRGTVNLRRSRFLDQAEFRRTKFDPSNAEQPSAVFALTNFSKPHEIVFDDVDLSRALFHDCDVSQIWFTSSVRWGKREGNIGLMVFDETISLEQEFGRALQRDGQRDYQAVTQIYQQLKKNYDSRLDYRTANAFHFGEMEMMRLAEPAYGKIRASLRVRPFWLRQWLFRHLTMVALYRWASDYGNSYWKPLAWLLGTLLAAALLFPITGLELKQTISASSARVTYGSVWNLHNSWTNKFWAEAKLIGKSGITAIDTATFQRTPEYAPVYPWGRVVAIVETLLTSSLFALFLLAIRRQFRR